jgi:hypothetical protein
MSDDPDRLAWLYSEGRWRLSDGPIARGDRDDFLVTSGEVGYTETPEPSGMAAPFLVLGRRPARISMFVRDGGATGVPDPERRLGQLEPLRVRSQLAGRPGRDGQVGVDSGGSCSPALRLRCLSAACGVAGIRAVAAPAHPARRRSQSVVGAPVPVAVNHPVRRHLPARYPQSFTHRPRGGRALRRRPRSRRPAIERGQPGSRREDDRGSRRGHPRPVGRGQAQHGVVLRYRARPESAGRLWVMLPALPPWL